ncbi:MAG: 1,4-alpha-glucan branching protein GlgB, partial [Ktedonobacterales bacterium]
MHTPPAPTDSTASYTDPLDQGAIDALIGGRLGAPFDVLGPHLTSLDGQRLWIVRAFVPGAHRVSVVPDLPTQPESNGHSAPPTALPMRQTHPAGLFSLVLPGDATIAYRLEIERFSGAIEVVADPYAFPPILSDFDVYLMAEGKHQDLYERLGAHPREVNGVTGTTFAVWAPNGRRVSVVGDFNGWDERVAPMRMRANGVWELFLPGVAPGALYKYAILSWSHGYHVLKADPFAFAAEVRPGTASRVWDLGHYAWGDNDWLAERLRRNAPDAPMSVYEVHAGSWKPASSPDAHNVTYRDLAHQLVPYVKDLGYTHIELLPIAEHPFDGSWGYQVTGYFAPTSRYGTPQDFMYFVDYCHQHGIGVLLDWVPAHFPKDLHGLAFFDGTHLYEHEDPRRGEQRDWGTLIFNFGRNEVRNFLISNALFWLERYHIDGLRVDAVASMLYLDYSREAGDWLPNRYGGRENLDAVSFLRECNAIIATRDAHAIMVAEESTAWPHVTAPVSEGGLGFSLKWNMGWMHDMLEYTRYEPVHRSFHHNELTFSFMYAFSEKFILPFSHDEVVHVKGSMLNKMPGDLWQKFANLRALYTFMYAHPGKKLLFMGGEFGQWSEWNFAGFLDWYLLEPSTPDSIRHQQLQRLVRDLNLLLRTHPALYECDFNPEGFAWIDGSDTAHSVIAFMRYAGERRDPLVVVCNFTPVPRHAYRVGVPALSRYDELLNSDAEVYGGGNLGNLGGVDAERIPMHGFEQSIALTLPPLSTMIFQAGSPLSDLPNAKPTPAAKGKKRYPR